MEMQLEVVFFSYLQSSNCHRVERLAIYASPQIGEEISIDIFFTKGAFPFLHTRDPQFLHSITMHCQFLLGLAPYPLIYRRLYLRSENKNYISNFVQISEVVHINVQWIFIYATLQQWIFSVVQHHYLFILVALDLFYIAL